MTAAVSGGKMMHMNVHKEQEETQPGKEEEGEAALKANVCQVVMLFHCSTGGGSNIPRNVTATEGRKELLS